MEVAGRPAYCGVFGSAGIGIEGAFAYAGIVAAGIVKVKRIVADGRVLYAIVVLVECQATDGCITRRIGIGKRKITNSGVRIAANIAHERIAAHSCIVVAVNIVVQSPGAVGSVFSSAVVPVERLVAGCCIVVTGSVSKQRFGAERGILIQPRSIAKLTAWGGAERLIVKGRITYCYEVMTYRIVI